jgi:hypothetical protein
VCRDVGRQRDGRGASLTLGVGGQFSGLAILMFGALQVYLVIGSKDPNARADSIGENDYVADKDWGPKDQD